MSLIRRDLPKPPAWPPPRERAAVQARATSIDTALEAALALVDLERALGCPLPDASGTP